MENDKQALINFP